MVSLLFSLYTAACSPSQNDNRPPSSTDETPPIKEETRGVSTPTENSEPPELFTTPGAINRDLTYCTPGGIPLKMDLYSPENTEEATPAILYIHGGGWTSGDKSEASQIWDFLQFSPKPYTLISINYRLAPANPFPAPIADVKCAVRYLRLHAASFRIDPDRIGVIGASAGGHLSALLGLTGGTDLWVTSEYDDVSSQVSAVTVIASPSDFSRDFTMASLGTAQSVFGIIGPDDPKVAEYSPVNYIDEYAPPFLILHGEKDSVVPLGQAYALFDGLKSTGGQVELVLIKNARHSLNPVGGSMDPRPAEIALKMIGFFDENLYGDYQEPPGS